MPVLFANPDDRFCGDEAHNEASESVQTYQSIAESIHIEESGQSLDPGHLVKSA